MGQSSCVCTQLKISLYTKPLKATKIPIRPEITSLFQGCPATAARLKKAAKRQALLESVGKWMDRVYHLQSDFDVWNSVKSFSK